MNMTNPPFGTRTHGSPCVTWLAVAALSFTACDGSALPPGANPETMPDSLTQALLPTSDIAIQSVEAGDGATAGLYARLGDASDSTYVQTVARATSGQHTVGYSYTGSPGVVTDVTVQYRADSGT